MTATTTHRNEAMKKQSENIIGWVGITKSHGLAGWVYNPRKADERLKVKIIVNGVEIATLQADEEREHLQKRGIEDTRHGFSYPMPRGYKRSDIKSLAVELVNYPGTTIKGEAEKSARISSNKKNKVAIIDETLKAPTLDEVDTDKLSSDYFTGHVEERRALEQEIENLKDRNRVLAGFLDNRKKEVEELKKPERELRTLTGSSKSAVGDAVRQMWGGYAEEGQRALLHLANSGYVSAFFRATACYELARFYADTGRPFAGARMMADARRLSKSFMRGLRPRLLEADLLLRSGDLEASRQRLNEHRANRPNDPNYLIGLANTFHHLGDRDGVLASVNEMFEGSDMYTIQCQDRANPFLSLRAPQDTKAVTDGPKVSILISSYNSVEFLRLAIGSIQEQTWKNIEILVTDDCSTDGSREILREMAQEDPRLVIIENKTNFGTYGNRNAMLHRATGEFVTVHDSDDWSHPQMIEHQVKHLMENPQIRLNTTLMCRVSLDLQFYLRPSRASLEFCHMNYPGFLMRRTDILALGGWDPIMANADAEFERRVKQVYGREAFEIINPDVAYSFFLVHENSLTQQKKMNLRSLSFGSRNEYHRQSEHWMSARRKEAEVAEDPVTPFVLEGRQSRLRPFPSPNSLMIPSLKKEIQKFDVLIMSDLTLLGGTRSCNINYLRTLHAMGKNVALFNWPRSDLRLANDINGAYRDLKHDGVVDIVTWEDVIHAKRVLIHHPPIAAFELDSYPQIEAEKVSVLVNQLPFQTRERERFFYHPQDVNERLKRIFDVSSIEWISISPLTKNYLNEFVGQIIVSDEVWYPPEFKPIDMAQLGTRARHLRMQAKDPSFVRHSRDHWTKWPSSVAQCRKMYMGDNSINFTILGGAQNISRKLVELPETWTVHNYDSASVESLLSGGDIYLNFNNEVYIEEFGRNVMEALSHGLPVIAEPVFAETFGNAVLIPDDSGPPALVDRLRSDADFFEEQVFRGVEFVRTNCSASAVAERMQRYLS